MSSKSNDGEDSKRPRESSLHESIANATNTDVFTEYLKSEDCAAIFITAWKSWKKKVLQMCEKAKDSQIKGESQLNSLSEATDFYDQQV